MNECLKEEVLLDLLLGEGSAEAQLHIKGCAACARNYKNLTQHMKLIETALSAPPPPAPVGLRLLSRMPIIAPAFATALAVFVTGFWLGQRFLPSNAEIVSASAANSSSPGNESLALAERSSAQLGGEGQPASASYVTFLQDNFEQDDTCLGQDRQFNPACSRSWTAENR